VGPLGSGREADAPDGIPRFGALWRIYQVELPTWAGVFVPEDRVPLRQQLNSKGVATPPVSAVVGARPDVGDYLLRVAMNPSCFVDADHFPQSCQWLDSQAAIEGQLSSNAPQRTDFAVTCTLTSYLGQPVPKP
jgi:hypothetical protein